MPAENVKQTFTSYKRAEDVKAEKQLLGRVVDDPEPTGVDATLYISNKGEPNNDRSPTQGTGSSRLPPTFPPMLGLNPRPKATVEPTTQMSFRIPLSLARQFRRKARYNQLEQQEIIAEVLRLALAGLPDPPVDWNE